MLQFYQYPPCTTCKRAKKELEELGLDFDSINIKENPPQVEQFEAWLITLGKHEELQKWRMSEYGA